MRDAGCEEETIAKVYRLYADGQVDDAVKILRRHRCCLMEQLHESQGKVDCLDFLVRRLEKTSGKYKKYNIYAENAEKGW